MKKHIIAALSLLTLLSASSAWAVCPAMTENPAVESQTVMQKLKEYASQLIDKLTEEHEEESQEARYGNADCSDSPNNTKPITMFVYEFLKEEVLDKSRDDGDNYIARTKDYAQAREDVKKQFFAKANVELTERGELLKGVTGFDMSGLGGGMATTFDRLNIMLRRDDYLNDVAAKNLDISTKLREKIIDDLKSTQDVATDGCNQLQGMLLENRNLAALLSETASDIIVQILTIESLAARNLQKETIELLTVPKKPVISTN